MDPGAGNTEMFIQKQYCPPKCIRFFASHRFAQNLHYISHIIRFVVIQKYTSEKIFSSGTPLSLKIW